MRVLNVKKEAVSPGTVAFLMLTNSPDEILKPIPVKQVEVKKREKIMKPQTPEEINRIVKEQEILHLERHGEAAVWGAGENAVMFWSSKPLGYLPIDSPYDETIPILTQSCCDGSKAPAKICSASAKIWDIWPLPAVYPSTNPNTGELLPHTEFMKPIIAKYEKKSDLIDFSEPSSPVSSRSSGSTGDYLSTSESSGYRSQTPPSFEQNSTPSNSGENSPLAVPFASPPNAGILQQRLQDHEDCQEIEGRALEVLEDSEFGSGKFGRRFNLGSPEQHVQSRDPLEYHEGNPFLRVLAHGGRQYLEGPQDYEPGTPINGCALRPFALQLPVFGGLEERSLQFNEGHQDHEERKDLEEQQGFQPLLDLVNSTEYDQTKVNILRLLELANSNEDLASPLEPKGHQDHGDRQAHGGLHEAHPYWNNLSGGRRYQEGRQHEHGFQPLIVHGAQGHEGRQDPNGCVAAGWGFQPLRVPGAQFKEKFPEQPKYESALSQQEQFWSDYYKNVAMRKGSGRLLRDPTIKTLQY